MISDDQVIIEAPSVENVSDRLTSVFLPVTAPRIHSPLNDLPSRGFELIDFADQIIPGGFMPWQKWLAEFIALKLKARWQISPSSNLRDRCETKWKINLHDGANHDGLVSLG
jgi:hypothetical protein